MTASDCVTPCFTVPQAAPAAAPDRMESNEEPPMGMPRKDENCAEEVYEIVDSVYRSDSRRVLATLVRLLGDFDLAEEAMHDAFAAAVEQWPQNGVPSNPQHWRARGGRS